MRPGQPKLSPERRVRIAKAVELKLRGMSYSAIGEALGVSISVAWEDCWYHFSELDKMATEKLEQVRKLELARLDKMLLRLFDVIEGTDDSDAVKAIGSATKVMERRAKLLGLDAPTETIERKVDGMSEEQLIERAKQLIAERESAETRH